MSLPLTSCYCVSATGEQDWITHGRSGQLQHLVSVLSVVDHDFRHTATCSVRHPPHHPAHTHRATSLTQMLSTITFSDKQPYSSPLLRITGRRRRSCSMSMALRTIQYARPDDCKCCSIGENCLAKMVSDASLCETHSDERSTTKRTPQARAALIIDTVTFVRSSALGGMRNSTSTF